MNIHTAKKQTLSRLASPTKKAETLDSSATEPKESFLRTHGIDMLVGGVMGAFTAVPVVGAIPSGGMAHNDLFAESNYWDRDPVFRTASGLGMGASAAANLVGTYHLFTGNTGLGISCLAGAGILGGVVMALNMDGGSMASTLGLKS